MMSNHLAIVQHGHLILASDQIGGAITIEVGSPEWFAWVEAADAFAVDEQDVSYIAHRMHAGEFALWLAYCAVEHEVRWVVLGSVPELTWKRLQSAASQLLNREDSVQGFPPGLSTGGAPVPHLSVSSPDLLVTKLEMPIIQTARLVRTRAVDRLTQALLYPLTVVSAPSGYGKSTVLTEWTSETDAHVAWLLLDENDNDPVRFCTYVLAALDRVVPGALTAGMPLVRNARTGLSDVSLVPRLINLLAAADGEIVLVLDDYHALSQDNGTIHEAMLYFIEHLPAQVHVILSTRTMVPLRVAKLRVQRRVLELRIDDLRFTEEEAQAFLEQGIGEKIDANASGRIQARTEGWVAGLQLAVLALEEHPTAAASLVDVLGEHRYVVDFLADEVLRRLPPEVRERVLRIAALDRFNADLCDALPGVTDSQATLEALERENAFLVPLDDFRGWYRFHGLFAEVLRKRLRQTHHDELGELYHQASAWHEMNGAATEAVRYAWLAGEEDVAVRIVDDIARRLLEAEAPATELWNTLEQCLDALPAPVIRKYPQLCLAQAEVFLQLGHLDESERWLEDASALVSAGSSIGQEAAPSEDHAHLEGEIGAVRNTLAQVRQNIASAHQAAVSMPLLPLPAAGDQTETARATSAQVVEFERSLSEIADIKQSRASMVSGAPPVLFEPISAREMEVLELLAAGASNQIIAHELVIAVATVKRHLGNIFRKLSARSRTQAVAHARALHLIEGDATRWFFGDMSQRADVQDRRNTSWPSRPKPSHRNGVAPTFQPG